MKRNIAVILWTACIMAALLFMVNYALLPTAAGAGDKYENYGELRENEQLDEDYRITFEETGSDTLIMAIHGGNIEAGTTELTEQMASLGGYAYYDFAGIKAKINFDLHLTSTHFDESRALEMASKSLSTITFHGYSDMKKKHTYLGGLDEETAELISKELQAAGFSVSSAPSALAGKEKNNITNKNKRKKGVQIEISTAQRKAFFADNDFSAANRKNKTAEFYDYTDAIQKALDK